LGLGACEDIGLAIDSREPAGVFGGIGSRSESSSAPANLDLEEGGMRKAAGPGTGGCGSIERER